ncbi:MAG: amidase, partial [Calditrichaeota bacterium]
MTQHEEIALLPAYEIRKKLESKDLSPVEVVEACLQQIERYNSVINAVVTVNEKAIEEAKKLENAKEKGLLYGLPVGIKDVTETAGIRTTYGCRLYDNYIPEEDALVVQRLKAAGAIILGKTNTPEFAAGGNTFNEVFGRTCNPWNPELSAGGSTGGGAAGLITGMIALA